MMVVVLKSAHSSFDSIAVNPHDLNPLASVDAYSEYSDHLASQDQFGLALDHALWIFLQSLKSMAKAN